MNAYLEYAAVVLGVIYILLASRSIIWCWPAGILSSALYIYINIENTLYQDAILQGYYVLAGFYGWWVWQQKKNHKEEKDIQSYTVRHLGGLILLGILLFPIFGFVFSKLGSSLPYLDASVTVFSFIATWMTAKRILQNWLFWIVIDLVACVMYFVKGLHATSVLYVIYGVVALYAYFEWRKEMKKS